MHYNQPLRIGERDLNLARSSGATAYCRVMPVAGRIEHFAEHIIAARNQSTGEEADRKCAGGIEGNEIAGQDEDTLRRVAEACEGQVRHEAARQGKTALRCRSCHFCSRSTHKRFNRLTVSPARWYQELWRRR